MKANIIVLATAVAFVGCSTNSKVKDKGVTIKPVTQVQWQKLNPARRDKSPQAGTIWGDRKGEVETAFLAKFVDGFSSPPHIHNVSYRAIVIDGLIHNDDPKAANMWMPVSSYWTQPAGEAHITSAKGKSNIALVEIDKGPYLVKPKKERFDNGERPYNIHASNIIWNDKDNYSLVPLWKNSDGKVTGTMLKFSDKIKIRSESARLVVISGSVKTNIQEDAPLVPGSLITLKSGRVLISCLEKSECILYVKSDMNFDVN